MKATKIYLSLLVGLICSTTVISQTQRFEVGIVAGLNFSALKGEDLTDYAVIILNLV